MPMHYKYMPNCSLNYCSAIYRQQGTTIRRGGIAPLLSRQANASS
jgi:hypothetical protein